MANFKTEKQSGVLVYNRESKCLEEETVFEKGFMDFFYGTVLGRLLTRVFLSRKFFSRIYGRIQRKPESIKHIQPFIDKYNIEVDELIEPLAQYRSFNEFFIRKLKAEARPIEKNPETLISPADGRLIVYQLKKDTILPVKGFDFTIGELLADDEITNPWLDGVCLKIRLAPSDYHRFCYIDNGSHGPATHITGRFHSVSPLALRHDLKILQGNDREYMVLETENFGRVIHIDIGAMVVGKIHQHQKPGGSFSKGEEKGYFEFGGSTIILLFEPGKVRIDADILNNSEKGIETLAKYGSRVGRRIKQS